MQPTCPRHPGSLRRGFTLVELLIVIGIIVLLISVMIPVVSKVRGTAQNAQAQTFITQIARAVESYELDHKSFPGPLTNTEVYNDDNPLGTTLVIDTTASTGGFATAPFDVKKVTMPENLVLGLLGGLKRDQTAYPNKVVYDPRLIGGGAFSLNASGSTKRSKAYMEAVNLSWRDESGSKSGKYQDEAGSADDTIIPEFVDTYPDPMPILYLRAKRGAVAKAGTLDEKNNAIVTYDLASHSNRVGQYDLHQIMAYTNPNGGRSIGVGRKYLAAVGWGTTPPVHGLSTTVTPAVDLKTTTQDYGTSVPGVTYRYPYDGYAYFRNQGLSTPKETDGTNYGDLTKPRIDVPHQKDGYILISAGLDRIYGTRDDVTNFGTVGQ